jgi:hypothetical protein
MKLYAPQYYKEFHCIADACQHTCCEGWEIDIDEEQLARFRQEPYIAAHIEEGDPPHFRLLEGERCPFLKENGLCEMILRYGEDILCQICRDHPRFRSFWSDRRRFRRKFSRRRALRKPLFRRRLSQAREARRGRRRLVRYWRWRSAVFRFCRR